MSILSYIITFRVRCRLAKAKCILVMAISMSVSRRIPTLLHGPGCKLGEWQVHYWADLQSVHQFRCYDNIALNAKCQQVFALALRSVL